MDTINPNDISKLDRDAISFITLKNGKTMMVDESAPEKNNSNVSRNNTNINLNNNKISKKLVISKKITYSLHDIENKNNLNFQNINLRYNNEINNKRIIKNDFNLISYISKNTNFSLFSNSTLKSRKIKLTEKIKEEKNILNNNENQFENISTLKNNFKNNIINEEKPFVLNKSKKRRSRNLSESSNSLLNEKNIMKAKTIINFNLISDLNKDLTETQKKFNNLLTNLKQKRYKNSLNPKDKINYHKFYELYKNNEKEIRKFAFMNFKKIKYYQKPEKDNIELDKDSQDIYEKYKISKTNKNISDNIIINTKNIIYRNSKLDYDCSKIDRTSFNSYNENQTRASSEKKGISKKFSNCIGYSSTLICPSNIFKSIL